MTIHWKAVERHFTVVLFVCQFYTFSTFGEFINFGLGAVRSAKVKNSQLRHFWPVATPCVCFAFLGCFYFPLLVCLLNFDIIATIYSQAYI